jgi:Single-strand binding protein family
MSGWRCGPGTEAPHKVPFPESIPPGLNHLVLTGTLSAKPRQFKSPRGDPVALLRLAFPVRDPEHPQCLWTWASCGVEVDDALAGQAVPELQVGEPVLVGGQLSQRGAGDGTRAGVIVATIVHAGVQSPRRRLEHAVQPHL